jgi:hypothetical protein
MKKHYPITRTLNISLGFISTVILIFAFLVLTRLQPKMVVFDTLSNLENSLLTTVGFGLLVIFLFHLFSLLQAIRFIKFAERVNSVPVILIITGVISLILIFSDIALLMDIDNQYRNTLSQPEWSLLYPILVFQSLVVVLFLGLHLSGYLYRKTLEKVTRDINIFMVIQYVGLLCGFAGLVMSILGLIFSRGWMSFHTIGTIVILIFPYSLAVLFWLITKLREKDRQWFDEKQMQDIGKSSLITLAINAIYMIILFWVDFLSSIDVIKHLWITFHIFGVLFIFSLLNLLFASRE